MDRGKLRLGGRQIAQHRQGVVQQSLPLQRLGPPHLRLDVLVVGFGHDAVGFRGKIVLLLSRQDLPGEDQGIGVLFGNAIGGPRVDQRQVSTASGPKACATVKNTSEMPSCHEVTKL
jgi:hypothetical protein